MIIAAMDSNGPPEHVFGKNTEPGLDYERLSRLQRGVMNRDLTRSCSRLRSKGVSHRCALTAESAAQNTRIRFADFSRYSSVRESGAHRHRTQLSHKQEGRICIKRTHQLAVLIEQVRRLGRQSEARHHALNKRESRVLRGASRQRSSANRWILQQNEFNMRNAL